MSFLGIFSDYTFQIVALGSILVGIFSGALGSFAVLRKQSLLGDAMAHAALPGVAIAFILTLSKDPAVLLLGAIAAGIVGTLFMIAITQNSIIKKDAALGIILSVFFGFGVVLLTYIQKLPTGNKAGLDTFLFGNASTLIKNDVIVMAALGLFCLIGLALFWKEFKLFTFDREFAESLGLNTKFLDIILTSLIVVAIVVGLQTVGVVLMSAMIIAPAVAARQWTNKLKYMVLLSAFFGALAGLAGAFTSSLAPKIPTGPTIVVFVSVLVGISLFFAPKRGLLWDYLQHRYHKREIDIIRLATVLFQLSKSHKDPYHPHDIASISSFMKSNVNRTLKIMKRIGWVQQKGQKWSLTKHGITESERLIKTYVGNGHGA